MGQKQRVYRGIVLWVAFSAALTAFDWPIGSLGAFWREHAFLTSIVSGLLMLGVGLFAVDAWFKAREAKRWTQVSRIASKEMGFVTDNLLGGMDYLLSGDLTSIDGIDARMLPLAEIRDCLERCGFPAGPLHGSREARLLALLEDEQWVRLAVRMLDALKHAHRRNLAIWVPVIITVDSMTPLINESAAVNEAVFLLQDQLRTVVAPADALLSTREVQALADEPHAIREATVAHWASTRTHIVDLQQRCMRAAALTDWKNPHR